MNIVIGLGTVGSSEKMYLLEMYLLFINFEWQIQDSFNFYQKALRLIDFSNETFGVQISLGDKRR